MKIASACLLVLGAAALLVAAYLYSFCVPLESACHMGDGVACERLGRTMSTSVMMALAALASLAVGVAGRRWATKG